MALVVSMMGARARRRAGSFSIAGEFKHFFGSATHFLCRTEIKGRRTSTETRYALYVRTSQPHIKVDPIKNEASKNHTHRSLLRTLRPVVVTGWGSIKRSSSAAIGRRSRFPSFGGCPPSFTHGRESANLAAMTQNLRESFGLGSNNRWRIPDHAGECGGAPGPPWQCPGSRSGRSNEKRRGLWPQNNQRLWGKAFTYSLVVILVKNILSLYIMVK